MKEFTPSIDRQTLKDYALLVVGLLLSLFANGRYVILLATWLAPVFLLYFIRANPSKFRIGFVVAMLIPATMFNWQGVVPGSLWMLFQISLLITLVLSSAYLADWLFQRTTTGQGMHGILRTLIFPLAYTTSEFLLAQVNPYGTFSVLAYTQWGILPILQLVSVTGLWGISFLIYWTAAVINQVWESGFNLNIPKAEVKVFTGIFILVLLFGSIQSGNITNANAIGNDSVRVASISKPELNMHVWDTYWDVVNSHPTDFENRNWTTLSELTTALMTHYLTQANLCAQMGAKIIVLQEAALPVMDFDLDEMVGMVANFSTTYDVYFGLSTMVIPADMIDYYTTSSVFPSNKVMLIGPDGTVLSDYSKHNAIFGVELIETDDSPLTIVDTPYGKIALVICFDMDHHEMPFQAREADIVFDVSNDWIALDPFHTQMAAVNGIANGYSVVRPTGRGLSMASDFRGNVLGTTDVYPFDADGDAIPEDWVQNSGTIMIANVPTVGTTTVYSVVGDLFGFACVMGLITLVLYGVFGKRLKLPIKFADSGSRDE